MYLHVIQKHGSGKHADQLAVLYMIKEFLSVALYSTRFTQGGSRTMSLAYFHDHILLQSL